MRRELSNKGCEARTLIFAQLNGSASLEHEGSVVCTWNASDPESVAARVITITRFANAMVECPDSTILPFDSDEKDNGRLSFSKQVCQKAGYSVIVVTHNSAEDIESCLESILSYSLMYEIELIVIDNASVDLTRAILQKYSQTATIILNGENVGYGRACNQGSRISRCQTLLFCNSDVVLKSDIFAIADEHIQHGNIGVIAPQVLNDSGYETPCAFRFPHPPLGLVMSFARRMVGQRNPNKCHVRWIKRRSIQRCDWVLGACMFVPKSVYQTVQGFDERFFLYFEEIDLCRRIGMLGFPVFVDRRCYVYHKRHGSSCFYPDIVIKRHRNASEQLYYLKHYGKLGLLMMRALDRDGSLFYT